MNNDLFRYKLNSITFFLLLSYACAHVYLTGVYVEASLEDLMQGVARLPFGQRLLVPKVALIIHNIFPLEAYEIFFFLELGFVILLYFSLKKLLETTFDPQNARCLSWLFILLLPLITIINYRYTLNKDATFYYPYDTATLFFMVSGYWCCLQQRWLYFFPLLFLATLNRESSILLVLLIPTLNWQNKKQVAKQFALALTIYWLTQSWVIWMTSGLSGTRVEWFTTGGPSTHFAFNLAWLLHFNYLSIFLECMAGIPLLWFVFYDFIPPKFRPLRYLTLIYFVGLLVFGMFMEARIFEEIVVLLYLPVCIAIHLWLDGAKPVMNEAKNVLYYIDRYSVLSALLIIIIFKESFNDVILWLAQWH